VSPDVIDVEHDATGQPILVLGNNDRKPMPRIVRNVAGYTIPVFVSLVLAALSAPRLRWRLTGRAGGIRIGVGLVVMVLWNGFLTVLVGSYAVAAANRGTVPGGLRLAGSFGDIVQVFVPFVVFVVLFVRGRRPAGRAEGGRQGPDRCPPGTPPNAGR
jgi:hypothetical protein